MTLVELTMGMVILAVLMTGVFGAVRVLGGSYSKTAGLQAGTSATSKVFLRFEKQVRYARRINPPANVTVGSTVDTYVEMLLDTPGTDTCVQWRLVGATDTLQSRQWLTTGTAPSTWATVAPYVDNDATLPAQAPFVFTDRGGSLPYQKLDVHLYARGAANQPRVERQASFIARNSNTFSAGTICANATGKAPRP